MSIKVNNKMIVRDTNSFTPIPSGQFSTPIKFQPELMYGNNFHPVINQFGTLGISNLADHSTINNINGVPTGVPANKGMWLDENDFLKSEWYNVGAHDLIIELDGVYNLDYAYIWLEANEKYGYIGASGSEDGVRTNYKELFEYSNQLETGKWYKLDFDYATDQAKTNNKYFILHLEYPDIKLNALVLYGREIGVKLIEGTKFKRRVVHRKVDQYMGTNGFYREDAALMSKVSGTHRFYVVPQWTYGDDWANAGAAAGKTVNDIEYRWEGADVANVDLSLQAMKNNGAKVMVDVNASPAFLRALGTTEAQYSKAVDPGLSSVNINHTTDPMSYKWIARISYAWAARYGANRNADVSMLKLVPGEVPRVGLGLIEVLEIGNEFDRWWKGEQMYHNAQEMAAYMSAIYDGHQGRMGATYGIKDADPSMKVSLVSFAAGANVAYLNEIIWWCDKYRGKGDYPFDLINYHWYNSSEGSQDASTNAHGIQPEIGNLVEANLRWVDIRDKLCPNVEVWLTEVGYDEHYGGVFSPQYATQFERSRHKAYWLTRTYMINQVCGVDVTNQYWFSNHGVSRLEDLDQYEPNPGQFLSSGLVDGIQNASDWKRKPLMSFWYVANFKHALTGFTYQHQITQNGVNKLIGTTLINSTDARIWSVAYKNYITGENLVAVWLSSANFGSLNVSVNTGLPSTQVTVIDEADTRESTEGVVTTRATSSGVLTLTINECPTFIRVANIGTPQLQAATNVRSQKLTKGGVNVTWVDRNIVDTHVEISRSTSLNGSYTVVYQGDTVDGTAWVDELAQPNVDYFYKVNIIYPGTQQPPVTPTPPVVTWNDSLNIFVATHDTYPGEIVYSTNNGTYVSYSGTVSVGNVARPAGYYKVKIRSGFNRNESSVVNSPAFTETPTEDPNFHILNTEEATASHAYYMKHPNNLNFSNTVPVEGDSVKQFTDLKGTANLVWEGGPTTSFPTLTGYAPKLHNSYVDVDNLPYLQYSSANYTGKAYPYEFGGVQEVFPGQQYEAYFNDAYYYGNSGDRSRIIDNSFTMPGSTIPQHFVKVYYHVMLDNGIANLWLNGVSQGPISHSTARQLYRNTLFVYTNNAVWASYSHYVWKQKLTDANRATIMSSIMAKFGCGVERQTPYAYDIDPIYNSTTQTWTVAFATKNLSGGGINLAATQYEWIINYRASGQGDFSRQYVVGTGSTLTRASYQAHKAQYNPNNDPTYFRVRVKAVASNGVGDQFITSEGYVQE